jgi:hypothetical protein
VGRTDDPATKHHPESGGLPYVTPEFKTGISLLENNHQLSGGG